MKDALAILSAILLAFPVGMAFSAFLRWLSRQKRDAQSRRGVSTGWVWLVNWGVAFSLAMAVLHGVEHQMASVERDLTMLALYFVIGCGALCEMRLYAKRH